MNACFYPEKNYPYKYHMEMSIKFYGNYILDF